MKVLCSLFVQGQVLCKGQGKSNSVHSFITLHLICKSRASLTHTSVYLRSSFRSQTCLEFELRCLSAVPSGELNYIQFLDAIWCICVFVSVYFLCMCIHIHTCVMCIFVTLQTKHMWAWKSVGTKTEIESGAIYFSASYNVGLLGLQSTDN